MRVCACIPVCVCLYECVLVCVCICVCVYAFVYVCPDRLPGVTVDSISSVTDATGSDTGGVTSLGGYFCPPLPDMLHTQALND